MTVLSKPKWRTVSAFVATLLPICLGPGLAQSQQLVPPAQSCINIELFKLCG